MGRSPVLPSLLLGRPDSPVRELVDWLCDSEGLLPDPSVGNFLDRSPFEYDDTLHCLYHLDQVIRSLAFMPRDVIPRQWRCVIYLSGHSTDGVTFDLLKTGRDRTGERNRLLGTDPSKYQVGLEYILATWLGEIPGHPSKENSSAPDVSSKWLVLLCDFYNSYRWKDILTEWSAGIGRPASLSASWPRLNVTLVTWRDVWTRMELFVTHFERGVSIKL